MLRATSLTLLASLLLAASAEERPCDILAAAGNPCVAAHSTVRALYALYAGPLYRVTRPTSPTTNVSANISVLGPGGFADIAAHERFCAKRDCVIANIFDQSPQHNHLNQRISDGVVHKMVNASKHKISVAGGVEVFGMMFDPGHGYHVDYTTGVAKGNDPESIYAVMSGKNYNGKCCFDCKNDHGGGVVVATEGLWHHCSRSSYPRPPLPRVPSAPPPAPSSAPPSDPSASSASVQTLKAASVAPITLVPRPQSHDALFHTRAAVRAVRARPKRIRSLAPLPAISSPAPLVRCTAVHFN